MPHPLAQAAAGHMACAAARLWSTRAFSCWIRPGCCSYVHPAHVITACRMSGVANHGGVHVRGRLPDGVWPTMITPLLDDERKSVDWEGLDILTEWFIRSGVAGLFSICLSSEMFHLSNEERLQIAQRVVNKAAGRVPVVAGATFEGGLEAQAELMKAMGKITSAVVIITNQIARMEDSDEVWIANAQKLLNMTGDIPLGLYETPVPKVRSLTPAMLSWAAKTGRFVFHKDTSLMLDTMLEKLRAVQTVPDTPLKFYTAKIQFLKTLLDNGGNGFSGITPNFMPWPVVWLCNAGQGKELEEKRCQVQHLLSLTDKTVASKYPTSAKFYLNRFYNVPFQPVSRMFDVTLNDQDTQSLKAMKDYVERVCGEVGIMIVDPIS